jgi:hypothetical protein
MNLCDVKCACHTEERYATIDLTPGNNISIESTFGDDGRDGSA